MNNSPIKVMVVDDHPVVRDGLKLMLTVTPGFQWVGQAENGAEAVTLCADLQPDVILMDLIMPEVDGPTAIQLIHQQYPAAQVVALTSFDDRELVQKALRAGAMSYVLKNASTEIITNTIRDAYAGRPTIDTFALKALVDGDGDDHDLFTEQLTRREREVLKYLVAGLKNAEIAQQMSVGESTVRFHVSNILSKLGATNRTQAASIAISRGLV